MNEILITSSVLIAAILVLRFCFRNRISRRFQYALWALVLVRLLLPVKLPPLPFSVLRAGTEAQQAVTQTMEQSVPFPERKPVVSIQPQMVQNQTNLSGEKVQTTLSEHNATPTATPQRSITLSQVLRWIWVAGMAVMALYFVGYNLIFWHQFRKTRIPFPVPGWKRPIYLCPGLPSPCLFGLVHPAIYLTPEAATPARLHHVLTHEETHARHLDPLWSLLRCVCLTIYWFHPLVWVAALVSRIDCELACDEGALRRLDEKERFAYGQTLLSLVPVERFPADPLLTATTMASGKRQLKERICRIAQRPRQTIPSILSMVLLIALVSACTFTGAPVASTPQNTTLTGKELAYFNEQFFNTADYSGPIGINIRNQFLCCLYEKPEDIDLFELFYVDEESTDGTWDARCFFTLPDDAYWAISFFSDLFGQQGLVIHYFGKMEEGYHTNIQDYYTFETDGTPSLLARAYDEDQILDLDGDGENELATPYQFFYQRNGKIYETNLKELLTEYWAELEYWDYSSLDSNAKAVSVRALTTVEGWGEQRATSVRDLYFDEEHILVYQDERPTVDHILGTIDVPEEVLQEALAMGEARYESDRDEDLDDWRVTAVEQVPLSYYGWSWDGPEVEAYRVVCEFHSADPAHMLLAGGAYVDENGWAGGILYGQSVFLVCTLDENGERTFLESLIPHDCDVGGPVFFDYLLATLEQIKS